MFNLDKISIISKLKATPQDVAEDFCGLLDNTRHIGRICTGVIKMVPEFTELSEKHDKAAKRFAAVRLHLLSLIEEDYDGCEEKNQLKILCRQAVENMIAHMINSILPTSFSQPQLGKLLLLLAWYA